MPMLFLKVFFLSMIPEFAPTFSLKGDASTTRGDFEFGDNWDFNETLFEQVRAQNS